MQTNARGSIRTASRDGILPALTTLGISALSNVFRNKNLVAVDGNAPPLKASKAPGPTFIRNGIKCMFCWVSWWHIRLFNLSRKITQPVSKNQPETRMIRHGLDVCVQTIRGSCVSLYWLHAMALRKVAIRWQVRSSSALISVQTDFHASHYLVDQTGFEPTLYAIWTRCLCQSWATDPYGRQSGIWTHTSFDS